jgi:PBSX family phage terminase large subunit
MSLSYKVQALEARLRRLEKETQTISALPSFEYLSYGACNQLQDMEDSELLIAGAAGTGKSTAVLAKIHRICLDTPHVRVLMVRKTKASMAETTLKTFEAGILGQSHPLLSGPTRVNRKAYVYPNGARIVVAGMDNAGRIMSSDYDLVYVQEATELSEGDWDMLLTRLRNNVLHYQSIIGDCNPDSEKHWLYKRYKSNKLKLIKSVHEDNPKLYNPETGWTDDGLEYLRKLDNLSGVRYKRYRLGEWAAAENAVFEAYDAQKHILYGMLPNFVRYYTGVDWGFTHPGAMLTFGQQSDGTLVLVDEILRQGQTVDWWVQQAKTVNAKFKPKKFICDPSQPAHIQALSLVGLPTAKAPTKIQFGLSAINTRLEDYKLRFHINSLKMPDPDLLDCKKPVRLTDELPGYVWNKDTETPVNIEDDAISTMRYVVSFVDRPKSNMLPATSTSIRG